MTKQIILDTYSLILNSSWWINPNKYGFYESVLADISFNFCAKTLKVVKSGVGKTGFRSTTQNMYVWFYIHIIPLIPQVQNALSIENMHQFYTRRGV